MDDPPRRIHIVGVSGTGKSTLARQVAAILDVPRLELDEVFWDANWTYRDLHEARAIIRTFLDENRSGWVVEGGWTNRLGGLLDTDRPDGPDLVVWPDHRRRTVMCRIVTRTLRRAICREELWHGNREEPRSWLRRDPDDNIIRWAWVMYPETRNRMQARIDAGEPVLRLDGQRAVDGWLGSLKA
ncbi:AAA family ATPase [Gordonia sp. ABSL49_1]|uniref:AAA family ATPase n=1 Tax=Gordonia sp. ABSL49_1 TaxID=2920941 RepID=UPI001F0D80BD|nr:AAA family ATPase [Gordonia sp. ABSL49_1]MCH5642850.1 AAA family ATPase [Gordonia sp. ABSL49_1]